MAKKERPSVERLRELLEYDPETGELRWKVNRTSTVRAGDAAGYVTKTGHLRVRVDGTLYMGHRIVWAMHHGEWPPEEVDIDHKDNNPTNNRLDNLRQASRSQNAMNSSRRSTNTSGYKGVYPHHDGRWIATVTVRYKRQYLGLYDSPEEAHAAYCKAAHELHGEFARTA